MKSNVLFDSVIALMFIFFVSYLSFNDYGFTLWLSEHSYEGFCAFMNQSVFQKGNFGASDVPIILDVIVLGTLFHDRTHEVSKTSRSSHGIVLSYYQSIVTSRDCHSLKISWGRARPYLVFSRTNGLCALVQGRRQSFYWRWCFQRSISVRSFCDDDDFILFLSFLS